MSLTNIKITPADGWVELSSETQGSFSLPTGGQYCFYSGIPPAGFIGHKFTKGVKSFTTRDGESLYVKVTRDTLGIYDLNKGAAEVSCWVYPFSSADADYLEIAPFTGNFKIILAATSEAGIPAAIQAGLQGLFIPSTDPVNDPQWNYYEIEAVTLTIVLESTFTGVCGGYAKDDVWSYVNMGINGYATTLTGNSYFSIPEYQAVGDFDINVYATANVNGFHLFGGGSNNRVAITSGGAVIVRASGVERNATPADVSWVDGNIHRFTIRRRSGTIRFLVDLVDTGIALSLGDVLSITELGGYTGSTSIPDMIGLYFDVAFSSATSASYPSGISSWGLRELGSETGYVYQDEQGLNPATGVNIQPSDEGQPVIYKEQGYNVIILAGQSNMGGAAPLEVGVDDDYSQVAGKVYQYTFTQEGILDAANPLLAYNIVAGSMGLWLKMVEGVQTSFDSRPILLICVSEGGTGFIDNYWNKGDPAYEAAVKRINDVMGNSNNTLQGFFWLQGENDADQQNNNYLSDITSMWNGFALDCPSISSSTKFICGEIAGSLTPAYIPIINADLNSFVATLPNADIVSNAGTSLIDVWHYDAPSLRSIGSQMATKFLAL